MPEKKQIKVTVSPTGEVEIDAQNFSGAECEVATRYLEEALGIVLTRKKKPEYTNYVKATSASKVASKRG